MKKRILLLMNCYEREQYVAEMIQDELIKTGDVECKILYWNRGIRQKDIYCFNPNVLMTFPLKIRPLISLVARIKMICNPIVVTFETEGYINTDSNNERHFAGLYDFAPELVDFWGVWGEKYGEYLWNVTSKKGKIKCRENIKVFGYPLWEHNHLQKIKSASDCEKKVLKLIEESKKTVLILSGFSAANKNRNDILNSIDAYDETSQEKDIQIESLVQIVGQEREYREKYYALAMAMIEANPEVTFLIKLHPKEIECIKTGRGYNYNVFNKWNNVEILMEDSSIGMYIEKVDAVVHYGSTAAWEAYICNKPTMKINGLFDGIYSPGECFESEERNDIMNWIKNSDEKLTYKNEYEEYIRDFFNYERKKEYAPSRELAQFLYEHSDSPHYYLKQYCRFAEIDNHFRRLLLKEGLRDIISLKFRFGMHKTWLALKSYK